MKKLWGSLCLVLMLVSPALALESVQFAQPRIFPLATGITTNTTTTAFALPIGPKSFYGQVVCSSGACVQTQEIYGDINADATNGILLCTLTLTATTADYDACPPVTANFAYYYVTTTNTSGTLATGAVYAMY